VAREAADLVLLERNLDVIRRGIEEGRRTFWLLGRVTLHDKLVRRRVHSHGNRTPPAIAPDCEAEQWRPAPAEGVDSSLFEFHTLSQSGARHPVGAIVAVARG
jgi:hypothetical protein